MRAQMEQTFKNLDRCLKAAGATWADVVKTNTFVTDFDEFQKCGDVRMRYFGVATPTSTTVGVTRLAGPDFSNWACSFPAPSFHEDAAR